MASHAGTWRTDCAGRVSAVGPGEAVAAAADTPHLMLNAALVGARLGVPRLSGLDILELFAFVAPAHFITPSPQGLAQFLGAAPPDGDAATGPFLQEAAETLLGMAGAPDWAHRAGAFESASALQRAGWVWAADLLRRIPPPGRRAANLFDSLPRREEAPPRPAPRPEPVPPEAVSRALARLRGAGRAPRQQQEAYAEEVA
ncbi:MAG: ATP-dependent DNA helicase, partial [Thermaurantiacus sp.]